MLFIYLCIGITSGCCILHDLHILGLCSLGKFLYYDQVAQIRITSKEVPLRVIDLAVGAEIDLPTSYFDALGLIAPVLD